jgi:hypothetical protein
MNMDPQSQTQSPFSDPAFPILDGDPAINDSQRADLHDAFFNTKSPEELVAKLQPLAVPEDTKDKLYQAKKSLMPAVAPLDKAIGAINTLKSLPPEVADYAEAHPTLAKLLIGAATTPEKAADEAGAAPAASSTTRKGGKSSTSKKASAAAPVVLPPRPDGLEHLPPVDPSNFRVLASDGGIHDVDKRRIHDAFAIDPKLQVLNPDA